MKPATIYWYRRDLRTHDNAGLYHALNDSGNVLPLFIFDTVILDKLEDKHDKRITFIYRQIKKLKSVWEEKGSTLLIRHGKPVEIFADLMEKFQVEAVYTNHDYEPYATERDAAIEKLLAAKGIKFKSFKDQVIFEKSEVVKDDGKPYTVFTPFSRKWRAALNPKKFESFPSENILNSCLKTEPEQNFNLDETGFKLVDTDFPDSDPDKEIIKNYDKARDIPSLNGTSRLGVHLRFGTISIRRLAKYAFDNNDVFLNELIWREFYMMILWNFPQVVDHAFKPQYDNIEWINDEKQFEAWCSGNTGYPIVDAGMRQLNQAGYMHNRVRMITASFLTKHLLIDWRWGEAYFAEKLLDFELASNNGGWQWAAGSGCDAVPYFRVFNPELQTKKFDPELKYIKKWVPEFQEINYPKPIVDHKFARDRALSAYKKALQAAE